jgi:transcriptional regulator with XRE-family HTH domain
MSDYETLKKRMLENHQGEGGIRSLGARFELARELIAARTRAGLTQEQLADKMHTTQSTIARLESGRTMPSLRTLSRYAEATGCRTVIKLEEFVRA